MSRQSLKHMALGLVVVGLVTLIPVIGTFALSPIAALAVGAIAAFSAAKAVQVGGMGTGLKAGAIAGIGSALGTLVAFVVLAAVLGSDPSVQSAVYYGEPHPEARIPMASLPAVATILGATAGAVMGICNFALSAFAGLLAGLFAQPKPAQTEPSVQV